MVSLLLRLFFIITFICSILPSTDVFASSSFILKVISTNGIVTGPGISCGGYGNMDCSEVLPAGTDEVLTVLPASGYKFVSWSGCTADPATPNKCSVTVNANRTVTATFARLKINTLTVTASPNIGGRVTSEPAGIECGNGKMNCTKRYTEGDLSNTVMLSAAAVAGYKFVSWSGCTADPATPNKCSVTVNANRTVTATFARLKINTLTVTASPNIGGRVTSEPAGIECGNGKTACMAKYTEGGANSVTLNATPVARYEFVSWRGCTADPTTPNKCSVTVNANKAVMATFNLSRRPSAPVGVAVTRGNTQATVSWTPLTGAISYNVYYRAATPGVTIGGTGVTKVSGAANGGVITGLINGTTYYFVVTAVNAGGESVVSSEVSATPQVQAPAAPVGVAVTGGNTQATVSWTSLTGAISYNVYYRAATPGVTIGGVGVTKVSGAANGGVITGLINGTTYYFVVTAVNAGGESAVSSEVSATLQTLPGTPTLNIPMPGDGRVTLSWSAPTTGGPVASYNVYYSAGMNVTTAGIEIAISGASTSYTVNGLTNATQYAFLITAVNSSGESAPSNAVFAMPAGVWTTKTPFTFQRDNAGIAVLNGLIYIMGGAPAGTSILDSMEVYDPATNIWTTKAPMPAWSTIPSVPPWALPGTVATLPTYRYGLSAAGINNVIYAIGGTSFVNGQGPIYPIAVYDPTSNIWSSTVPITSATSSLGTAATLLAPLPTGRWGLEVAVVDGLIYAIGGAVATQVLDANGNPVFDPVTLKPVTINTYLGTVEAYDPVANTWTTKASMPTPRWGMSVSVVNGLIYAIGGWAGWPELAVIEVYDPATDTWSTTIPGTSTILTPMPTARDDFGFAVVNGLIYVIGGDINAYDPFTSPPIPCCTTVMEAYDPVTNTWTTKAPMPTMRDDFDAVAVNGVIYAIGGSLDGKLAGGGISFTTVEAYSSSPIPVPTGLTATIGGGYTELYWNSVAGATSYNIYWSNKAGISTASGTKITGVRTPFVHTGLTTGKWYYYTVTAVTPSGESLPSNEVSVRP